MNITQIKHIIIVLIPLFSFLGGRIMKLLKVQIKGLKLFKGNFTIDFYAQQRVGSDKNEMLTKLFSNIYINNVISFIGINASGKTSVLKSISFVMSMLNNEPINLIYSRDILNEMNDEVVIETYFFMEPNSMYKLETIIVKDQSLKTDEIKYIIKEERLWKKDADKVKTKKSLFEFDEEKLLQTRSGNEEFLMDDVSIIIALNKKKGMHLYMRDMVRWTNINTLYLAGKFPTELIKFLDPNIEYLNFTKAEKGFDIRLKFKDRDEITLYDIMKLERYLSSGTIKGINVFINAMLVFEHGGYLIVDELENHFNTEIVSSLIRFFMNSGINKKGATIIFSTHYAELLDEFERNDNIYIVRNRGGITVENLSNILKRNDIKKSEAYQSGYLDGTTPVYEAYIDLKNAIMSNVFKEV